MLLTRHNLCDTRVDMMYYSENQEVKHATNALLANIAKILTLCADDLTTISAQPAQAIRIILEIMHALQDFTDFLAFGLTQTNQLSSLKANGQGKCLPSACLARYLCMKYLISSPHFILTWGSPESRPH